MSYQEINPVDDINEEVEHNEDFFVEHEEVMALLQPDMFLSNSECVERLSVIFQKYQENSELLDPYLEAIVQSLFKLIVPRVRALGGLIIDYTQNLKDGQQTDNVKDLCGSHTTSALSVLHRAFKAFYILCKARRHKAVSKFLPHDVRDLEPTLLLLSSQSGYLYGGATGIIPVLPDTWHTRYGLLIWLSVLALIPFDLATADSLHLTHTQISSTSISVTAIDCTPLVPRVILLCQLYLADAGAVRDAAAVVLGKLFSRPDMHHAHLASLCKWIRSVLQGVYSVSAQYQGQHIPLLTVGASDSRFGFIVAGSLYALAEVIKGAPRASARDLIVPVMWSTLVYAPRSDTKDALDTLLASTGIVWSATDGGADMGNQDGLTGTGAASASTTAASDSNSNSSSTTTSADSSAPLWVTSPLCRKLWSKCLQRLALSFLQPLPPHSHWRYQRGLRSLNATLHADKTDKNDDKNNKPADNATSTPTTTANAPADYWFVEEVLDRLLTLLQDGHTVVRWSAAKGVGRIVLQLPQREAKAVVEAVLALLGDHNKHNDCALHGALLALAELLRRGLLAPHYLRLALAPVLRALQFDVRRGSHSVGAHVRDAACYVLWSVARAYDADVLRQSLASVANGLLAAAMFDREVNCRRAASAAFQELVGRVGGVSHGIATLTLADYFTLSSRVDAYCKIASAVAKLELEGCGEDYLYLHQYNDERSSGEGSELSDASEHSLLDPALRSLHDAAFLASLARPRAIVFLDHLLSRCVVHWDAAIRELAARAVVALANSHVAVSKHIFLTLLPPLLGLPLGDGAGSAAAGTPKCCVFDVFARHGHLHLLAALMGLLSGELAQGPALPSLTSTPTPAAKSASSSAPCNVSSSTSTFSHAVAWAPATWRRVWPMLCNLAHTLFAKNLLVGVHTTVIREALASFLGGLSRVLTLAEDAVYEKSLSNAADAEFESLLELSMAWHAQMPVILVFLSSSLAHPEACVQREAALALSSVLSGAFRATQRSGKSENPEIPEPWIPGSLPISHLRTVLQTLLNDARSGSQTPNSICLQYHTHLLSHTQHAAAIHTQIHSSATSTLASAASVRLARIASLTPAPITPAQLKQCTVTVTAGAAAAGNAGLGASIQQGVCRLLSSLPAALLAASLSDTSDSITDARSEAKVTAALADPLTTLFATAARTLMPLTNINNNQDPLARAFAAWTLGSMIRTLSNAVESGSVASLLAASGDNLSSFPRAAGYVWLVQLLNQVFAEEESKKAVPGKSATGIQNFEQSSAPSASRFASASAGYSSFSQGNTARLSAPVTNNSVTIRGTAATARGTTSVGKIASTRKTTYFIPSCTRIGVDLKTYNDSATDGAVDLTIPLAEGKAAQGKQLTRVLYALSAPSETSPSLFAAILNTLLACCDDYQSDNRGDVGSWTRSCAMVAATAAVHAIARARQAAVNELTESECTLAEATDEAIETDGQQNADVSEAAVDSASSLPHAIPAAALAVLARALAQQAGERIDRLRRCAIECLAVLAAGNLDGNLDKQSVVGDTESTSDHDVNDPLDPVTDRSCVVMNVPHSVWLRKSIYDTVCAHLHNHAAKPSVAVQQDAVQGPDAVQCTRSYQRVLQAAFTAVLSGQHVEHILNLTGELDLAEILTSGEAAASETPAASSVLVLDWMEPSNAFTFVALLACSPLYRYACVCCLAASGGGLTESTVRHAVEALLTTKTTMEWLQRCVVEADGYEEDASGLSIEVHGSITQHDNLYYYTSIDELSAHAKVTEVTAHGASIEVQSLSTAAGIAEAMGDWYGVSNGMGLTGITDLSFNFGMQPTTVPDALHIPASTDANTQEEAPADATYSLSTATEDATQRNLNLLIEAALPEAVRIPLYYYRPLDLLPQADAASDASMSDFAFASDTLTVSEPNDTQSGLFPLSPAAELFWDLLILLHAQKGDPRVVPAVYSCWSKAVTLGLGASCGPEEWYDIVSAATRRVQAEIAKTTQVPKLLNAVQVLSSLLNVALTICSPILGDEVFVVQGVEGLKTPARHPAVSAMNVLLLLLTHKYPKVRRVAAEALFSVMPDADAEEDAAEFGVSMDALNQCSGLLKSTHWDAEADVSGSDLTNEIVVNRNMLYTLLGMAFPKDLYAFGQEKEKTTAKTPAVGTYAELVREMY